METLSTSVSTVKLHTLPATTPRELYHFKPHHSTHRLRHLHNKPNSPISNRASFSNNNSSSFTSLHLSTTTQTSLHKHSIPPSAVHTKAATGYATALLDISLKNTTTDTVAKDVRRLSRMLQSKYLCSVLNDPCIEENTKSQAVKEIVEKGRFQKNLKVVMRMVIEKNGVGMVNEVLGEFERIYDELNGTQVVFVSSNKKLEEGQLVWIAKKVQEMSGAVKVKVKNLIKERSPSFAL